MMGCFYSFDCLKMLFQQSTFSAILCFVLEESTRILTDKFSWSLSWIQMYPPNDWLVGSSLPSNFSPSIIQMVLDQLSPDNVRWVKKSKLLRNCEIMNDLCYLLSFCYHFFIFVDNWTFILLKGYANSSLYCMLKEVMSAMLQKRM